jgi:hypothetical protein
MDVYRWFEEEHGLQGMNISLDLVGWMECLVVAFLLYLQKMFSTFNVKSHLEFEQKRTQEKKQTVSLIHRNIFDRHPRILTYG